MNSQDSRQPDANVAPRAIELLQRFHDRELAEHEVVELLGILDAHSDWQGEVRKSCRAEDTLRILVAAQTPLDDVQINRLRKGALTHYDITAAPVMVGSLDFDSLIDLAAKSPMLPQTSAPKAPPKPARPVKAYDPNAKGSLIPLRYVVPVLLLLFGVFVFLEWRQPAAVKEEKLATDRLPTMHAILADMTDVQWTGDTKTLKRGEAIYSESLSFEAGTIELLFAGGVRGVVEGPAEIALLSDKRVFCRRGKWSVTVPKQGRGFEIQTPQCTVRDLGTRFYTDVSGERCDVHVLDGTVELNEPGGKTQTLTTGQAASVTSAGPSVALPAPPLLGELFVHPVEMRRRSDALVLANLPALTKKVDALAPVLRVRFDAKSSDCRTFGGETVEGSMPDRSAFRFTGETDRVRVAPLSNLPAFTAVVRIRLDRLKSDVNPILMSEEAGKNGLVWQIRPNGKFGVGVRGQRGPGGGVFESPVVFTPDRFGRWSQLALTVDGRDRSVTVYIDGGLVFAAKLPRATSIDLDKLNLGSWKVDGNVDGPVRQVDGAVEALTIYDRVLDLAEIRMLEHHAPAPRPFAF